MEPIYTERSERFTSKGIVAFVALILNSHMRRIMSKTNLYKEYHHNQMLRHISKIKVFLDKDNKYCLEELTDKQKEILNAFQIRIPDDFFVNFFICEILFQKGD
jgi:transposase